MAKLPSDRRQMDYSGFSPGWRKLVQVQVRGTVEQHLLSALA
ncbi:MAG: hypothetical protein ACC633_06430 [Anaerolineales bacterium]